MNIIKPLQLGVLHRNFCWQKQQVFCVTVPITFKLSSGEILLEQEMWSTLGPHLKQHGFDTGMPKGSHEVVMVGHCLLPETSPTAEVNLQVKRSEGEKTKVLINKTIAVHGDREWIGRSVGPSVPFASMAIHYQHAYGGETDNVNPVGTGDKNSQYPPRLEYVIDAFSSQGKAIAPAAFCPIDYCAQQRLDYAGTYDQKYLDEVMPNLANDADLHYFNDTPSDQWLATSWSGDESIYISNMHPQQRQIECRLPPIYARAFVQQKLSHDPNKLDETPASVFKEIATELDTVWLCPNDDIGIMLYRGTTEAFHRDGMDIETLMIACENKQHAPRSLSHYEEQLTLRTCPDNGFKYTLFSQPLIADGMRCAFESSHDNDEKSLELLQKRNLDVYDNQQRNEVLSMVDDKKKELAAQLSSVGVDPEPYLKSEPSEDDKALQNKLDDLIRSIAPPIKEGEAAVDMTKVNLQKIDDIAVVADEMKAQSLKDAQAQITAEITRLKSLPSTPQIEQQLRDLEKALANLGSPPPWPRFDMDEQLSTIEQQKHEYETQLQHLRELGVAESELPCLDLNVDELKQQVFDGMSTLKQSYAKGAHMIDTAVSPHPQREHALRNEIIERLNRTKDLSNGDFACVDFTGLNLTGVNLSGCYLEGANFTGCDLSTADFSDSIAVSARFDHCRFGQTHFAGANFGRSSFVGATFIECDLHNTELLFASFLDIDFEQCKFPNLIMIDAKIHGVKWINCQLPESQFVKTQWLDCEFIGSNLSGCQFVEAQFDNVSFTDCDISTTNFVKLVGEGSQFCRGTLENTRFVAGCELDNSVFQQVQLNTASFREAFLKGAKFSDCSLSQADFSLSQLTEASLTNCNFTRSLFNGAQLKYSDLSHSNFMEASMYGAFIKGTLFEHCNLYCVNFVHSTLGDNSYHQANLDRTILQDWRP